MVSTYAFQADGKVSYLVDLGKDRFQRLEPGLRELLLEVGIIVGVQHSAPDICLDG